MENETKTLIIGIAKELKLKMDAENAKFDGLLAISQQLKNGELSLEEQTKKLQELNSRADKIIGRLEGLTEAITIINKLAV